jgi:lipopolysaccharide biosynthesis regulator YciM
MSTLPTIVKPQIQAFDSYPYLSLSTIDRLEIDEAIHSLTKKVKENSLLIDEYIELGRLFRKKGQYQKAFMLHRNLLIRDDLKREQFARVQAELGYDYLFSKTKDFGEAYFLESLKYNRDSVYTLEGLYQAYRQSKQYDKAADTLKNISKINPDRKLDLCILLCEFAVEKMGGHDISAAKKRLDQAFDLKVDSPHLYLTKAQILTFEGKRQEAIETLETLIQKWPETTLFGLKKIEGLYFELNQYTRYFYSLSKCLRLNPQNFYAHHAMGKYLVKVRQPDQAMTHFAKAVELCPFSIHSLKEMVQLYAQKNDTQGAMKALEIFLTAVPNQKIFSCSKCQTQFNEVPKECPVCAGWHSTELHFEPSAY